MLKHYKSNKKYHFVLTGKEVKRMQMLLRDAVAYNQEHDYPWHAVMAEKALKMLEVGYFLRSDENT